MEAGILLLILAMGIFFRLGDLAQWNSSPEAYFVKFAPLQR
jgi:hypothetical protein